MPLSDREQRLLDQMEQALYAEDPKFASSLQRREKSLSGRRIALGIVIFAAGLGGLLAGVTTSLVLVGILGFFMMLGGVLVAADAVRAPSSADEPTPSEPGSARRAKAESGFMDRVEERWRRRREGEHG